MTCFYGGSNISVSLRILKCGWFFLLSRKKIGNRIPGMAGVVLGDV